MDTGLYVLACQLFVFSGELRKFCQSLRVASGAESVCFSWNLHRVQPILQFVQQVTWRLPVLLGHQQAKGYPHCVGRHYWSWKMKTIAILDWLTSELQKRGEMQTGIQFLLAVLLFQLSNKSVQILFYNYNRMIYSTALWRKAGTYCDVRSDWQFSFVVS